MAKKPDTRSARSNKKELYEIVIRETFIPLVLIFITPNLMIPTLQAVVKYQSNFSSATQGGFLNFWRESWAEALHGIGDPQVWSWILALSVWSALSILCLGGEKYHGPPTKTGFKPEYIKSGFTYYILTLIVFGAALYVIPAWAWYKKMVQLAGALGLFGSVVCGLLLAKGLVAPSPGEHGSSSNPVFDFYWGLELYPRLGRWFDVKMWTNCRFGMMLWQLIVLVAWKAQYEHTGWNYAMAATTILQSTFIAKFYWWEDGYMKSIDIILDRAGFYICWGCIFFVPTFYTLTSTYMVENSPSMSSTHFWVIITAGILGVGLNYWPDYQRQLARASNGRCRIWGKPAKMLRASYTDSQGQKCESLLLASGFWGLSRHINYVFEITASLLWESPAGFGPILPYLYAFYLMGLLTHRSFRDEAKCRLKYGKHWEEYCRIAKYQLIPFVF